MLITWTALPSAHEGCWGDILGLQRVPGDALEVVLRVVRKAGIPKPLTLLLFYHFKVSKAALTSILAGLGCLGLRLF